DRHQCRLPAERRGDRGGDLRAARFGPVCAAGHPAAGLSGSAGNSGAWRGVVCAQQLRGRPALCLGRSPDSLSMSDSVLTTTVTNMPGSPVAGDLKRSRPRGFSAFVRSSPLGALCLAVLLFAIAFAAIGPLVGTGNPEKIDPLAVFASPSRAYPMGADYLGRSVMARLAAGMRVSLLIALLAAGLAAAIGATIGLISGYAGGFTDEVIGRLADILFAFPAMLLGLLIVMVMEPGIPALVVTILVVTLPIFVRVARGPTLGLKQ